MNKRIKELAEVASKDNSDGYPVTLEYSNRFAEKFAELIVRECVTRLEQHHPFTKDPEAYLYAISLIEEHFGVEE